MTFGKISHWLTGFFLLLAPSPAQAATVGTWKAYMAYHDITEIEQGGDLLFILASDNLYTYNTNDQSLQTYDKVNALSDCNIAHIKYCPAAKRLVIVYENENIDLMDLGGGVTNLSDYYNASLTEDKTVNSIDIDGAYAYLSTGFGIVKVNVKDAEISDTYSLGFAVNYSYVQDGYLYATSSAKGLYRGKMTDNLLDAANWNRTGDYSARSVTVDEDLLATASALSPGGPQYNHFGFLKYYGGKLYSAGGGWSYSKDQQRKGCVQVLDNGNDEWQIYQDDVASVTGHNYLDVMAVAVDPQDNGHVFASGRTGLYEFENGSLKQEHNLHNSPLTAVGAGTNKNFVLVLANTFDSEGNLWCFNNYSKDNSLLAYNSTDGWTSHHKDAFVMKGSDVSFYDTRSAFFDSRGLLWMGCPHWGEPALLCYQKSSDAAKCISSFVNQDGTTISDARVNCVTEDLDKNIWLGTKAGPLMLTTGQITEDSPYFTQVKVPRNDGTNYADYLLDGVSITAMAVDGAGRKWFGTESSGVYLISEDNLEEIYHFTEENSKLLSDEIEAIAIDNSTGEVFFGTANGLCSYMSDAVSTNSEMTKDNVWAYPNPVRPDYTGLITVTGLSYQADVKIVTSNGVLVAEGKSNGGLFTWDGKDLKGKRVASGVYMVLVATETGDKGVVCKIAVVN